MTFCLNLAQHTVLRQRYIHIVKKVRTSFMDGLNILLLNPMHLSTPCFNTNRFKRQTAFRLVATMIQTATHMVLMWNFVECRSGLKQTFSENVSKKQHGLTKAYFRIPSILFYTEVLLICM